MKPKVLFSFVILAFILHSCKSEKKEIIGYWEDQKMPECYTHYSFNKDGTYRGSFFEGENRAFRHGSIGYYKYIGKHKFNLFEGDVDFSPVIGLSLKDVAVGIYFKKSRDSMVKPNLDSTKPSFLAQIQNDGENVRITQNGEMIVELKRKHIKFLDFR